MSDSADVHSSPLPQGEALTILSHASATDVKSLAEILLADLTDVQVIYNRTGLVMLPYTDSAKGSRFHLGEVLVAEARVLVAGVEGYGACLGHDVEQALAIAICDAVLQANAPLAATIVAFLHTERAAQQAADDRLLQSVALTRAEIETF